MGGYVNCTSATVGGRWRKRQRVASLEEINLDLSGDMQFGGVQLQQQVQSTEEQDRNDDGKVADEGAELEHIQGEERRCGQSTVLYSWVW